MMMMMPLWRKLWHVLQKWDQIVMRNIMLNIFRSCYLNRWFLQNLDIFQLVLSTSWVLVSTGKINKFKTVIWRKKGKWKLSNKTNCVNEKKFFWLSQDSCSSSSRSAPPCFSITTFFGLKKYARKCINRLKNCLATTT